MIRGVFNYAVTIVLTLFWSALGIATMPLSPGGALYLLYARTWSRMVLWASGVRLAVAGRERVSRARGPYLFMTNHASHFDTLALFAALPLPVRMVAKRELLAIPVFGWSMWLAGFVFIDRRDRARAAKSLELAGRRMRAGRSVVFFPEGTRSPDGQLLPFKSGGFRLAVEARVPVVPVAVAGSRDVLKKGSLRIRPGRIEVRIGEPIDVAGKSKEDLSREVEAAIRTLLYPPAPGTGSLGEGQRAAGAGATPPATPRPLAAREG